MRFLFLGWEDPLEKGIATHSSTLGEGNGTPLQYTCLENPMDRGAWWATVPGVAKSRTRLSDFTFTYLGQWDFADVVKLRALMRGPWIIQVGPI